ncbi:MAG: VOC family protein [Nitrososphaerales archaeon]
MPNPTDGLIQGLHHITLVTSNQEVNRRFYTKVLGLRRVKYSVNQDDPLHRHLFYANENASTGSAITFFEWPDLPHGQIGLGSPHHLAYMVKSLDAIPKWKSWLESNGLVVAGPIVRDNLVSIYFRDPDGVNLEITAENDGMVTESYLNETSPQVSEITSEMRLAAFNHATPISSDPNLTSAFFDKMLGVKKSLAKPNKDQDGTTILSLGNDEKPSFVRYLSSPKVAHGLVGKGNIHHIALAVEGDEEQAKILRRLDDLGIQNSGIIDRFWFHSLYFRDPDGNLLEVATKNPGYSVDESSDKLGTSLVLPKWLEVRRKEIESFLKETDSKSSIKWPPSYLKPSKPESLAFVNR